MTRYTPGPWHDALDGGWIASADHWLIGNFVDVPYSDSRQANARLCAAAPELLEAIQALVNVQNGPPLIEYTADYDTAMSLALAAIKKAEGRT